MCFRMVYVLNYNYMLNKLYKIITKEIIVLSITFIGLNLRLVFMSETSTTVRNAPFIC